MKRLLLVSFIILILNRDSAATILISNNANSITAGPDTITTPGQYRLANDIIGTITIAASNVTLDLEGRNITDGGAGISIASQREIIIKNGVIRNATLNGIIVNQCENIVIDSIDFASNVTGIVALTTTGLEITNCTFTGHIVQAINFVNVSKSKITSCRFENNTAHHVIGISNSDCLELTGLEICENTLIDLVSSGILINNAVDVLCQNCFIDNNRTTDLHLFAWHLLNSANINLIGCTANNNILNTANGTNFDGFAIDIGCKNCVLEHCFANSNQVNVSGSVAGNLRGFICDTVRSIVFTDCQANSNVILGGGSSTLNGFTLQSSSAVGTSEVYLLNCLVMNNTVSGASSATLVCFNDTSSSTEVIYEKCKALGNSSNLNLDVFDSAGVRSCIQECIAKRNTSAGVGTSRAFFIHGNNQLIRSNVAEITTGIGFNSISATNPVLFRNVAQGGGIANNYNTVSGFGNIVARFDPSTGAYTPPAAGGLPDSLVNISVTAP